MSRMRLICPNCAAQYEVPVDVIPKGGRDVQCSSCGHTWYQNHPDDVTSDLDALAAPPPDGDLGPADAAPAPRSRSIDPGMAELFREERSFEESQRAADALESQPDLGLLPPDEDERERRARQARERMARMRGEEHAAAPPPPVPAPEPIYEQDARVEPEAVAAAAAGSRRDLLPDVDEINQTLRASSEPRTVDTARGEPVPVNKAKTGGGNGFAKGFSIVVLLAAAAIAVYVFAPKISEAVPALAPYLEMYVAQVDTARIWLDGQVKTLLQTLDGMSSEVTDPDPADGGS